MALVFWIVAAVSLVITGHAKYFVSAKFLLSAGDSCRLNSGSRGTCKLFDDCDASLLRGEPGDPILCGWGADAIVCCPRGNSRPARLNYLFMRKTAGDSCSLNSGSTGTCKLFDDCDASLLRGEPGDPILCGWGADAIVCCPNVQSGRGKSKQKCKEYSEILKNIHSTHAIMGGERVTSPEEFPHMALIGFGDEHRWGCGGALISEQYILTAAHCTDTREGLKPTVALLGFLNINHKKQFNSVQQFRIVDIKIHPDHKPPQIYADIALLKLHKRVKFSKFVFPACLHQEKNIPVKSATATGWGSLERGSTRYSHDLMKVRLTLRSFAECSESYPAEKRKLSQGIVDDLQFCAGDLNKDACQGDSGGPLQTYHPELIYMHDLIGITSFGNQCGIRPGVYTRVSQFVPWIESIVWP